MSRVLRVWYSWWRLHLTAWAFFGASVYHRFQGDNTVSWVMLMFCFAYYAAAEFTRRRDAA